jgi:hypothetical protein
MRTFDIYFNMLTEEAQQELLEAFNINLPEEMNWDMLPVTQIIIDGDIYND